MKALFEVIFDSKIMIAKSDLKKFYNNDWTYFMKQLYKEEGIGIFNNKLRLVEVKRK